MATPGLSRLILAGLVTVAAFAASASAAAKVGEAVKITVRITGQAGALATGDAGTVWLLHPFTVHAAPI